MSDDTQKRSSVKYALEVIMKLVDTLIEDIEAREGAQSPLSSALKKFKQEV